MNQIKEFGKTEEDKQLYVSFEKNYYKSNKSNLLICRAQLIEIQKSLQRLKAIRSTKRRLTLQLASMIVSSNNVVQKVCEKFPEISPHKKLKLKTEIKKKKSSTEKPEDFEIDNLDKELLEINRKIKELNEN